MQLVLGNSNKDVLSLPVFARLIITLSKKPMALVSMNVHVGLPLWHTGVDTCVQADVEWVHMDLLPSETEDLLLFFLSVGRCLLRPEEAPDKVGALHRAH